MRICSRRASGLSNVKLFSIITPNCLVNIPNGTNHLPGPAVFITCSLFSSIWKNLWKDSLISFLFAAFSNSVAEYVFIQIFPERQISGLSSVFFSWTTVTALPMKRRKNISARRRRKASLRWRTGGAQGSLQLGPCQFLIAINNLIKSWTFVSTKLFINIMICRALQ